VQNGKIQLRLLFDDAAEDGRLLARKGVANVDKLVDEVEEGQKIVNLEARERFGVEAGAEPALDVLPDELARPQ